MQERSCRLTTKIREMTASVKTVSENILDVL